MSAPATAGAGPRILVLGYGNRGRQDDGLGPAVADAIAALRWPNVTTWENDQLALEDTIEVAAHEVVVFVDAAREGPAPFTLERIAPAMNIAFSSHLLAPETVLAIAGQQFGAAPQAYLLAIRGYGFEFQEGLTDGAARNLGLAVAALRERIAVLVKEAA